MVLSGFLSLTNGAVLSITGLIGIFADTTSEKTSELANAAAWFSVLSTGLGLVIFAVWKGNAQGRRLWLQAQAGTDRELLIKMRVDLDECEKSRKEIGEELQRTKLEFIAYKATEMQRISDLESRLDKMHDRLTSTSIMVLENGGWIAHEKAKKDLVL